MSGCRVNTWEDKFGVLFGVEFFRSFCSVIFSFFFLSLVVFWVVFWVFWEFGLRIFLVVLRGFGSRWVVARFVVGCWRRCRGGRAFFGLRLVCRSGVARVGCRLLCLLFAGIVGRIIRFRLVRSVFEEFC